MLVAALAYQQLTPAVRTRVDALLKLNPFYNRWLAAIPATIAANDQPAAIFMLAATWPDQIKSAAGYSDDGTANGDRPGGVMSSQNVGYTDMLRHKYWHFVDQPFSEDGTSLPAIPEPNAQDRIGLFLTTISSTASDDLKSYDLSWLLHLVGDIHQPLHAATRASHTQPDGDAGGNLVELCAKPCKNELHAFWDGVLGTSQSPSAVMKAATLMPAPDATKVNDLDPAHWATDSLFLAKADVYVTPIRGGAGPFTLTSHYKQHAHGVATAQAVLAGARLAALLNSNLK
jgi:hypothetical protein